MREHRDKHDNHPSDLLDWLGISNSPNWRVARPLGHFLGFIASAVLILIPLLVLGAFGAAGFVLYDTVRNVVSAPSGSSSPNLGAGALIAAILGAPFVIWGTVLKYQTVRYQKEGHMTDRISKAVEQLGAEKVMERIGRPVTIWTGQPKRISYRQEEAMKQAGQPRTELGENEWRQFWNERADEVEEGYYQTVTTWPSERTIIQWQGEGIALSDGETIGLEGTWQVFKETAPNIEVRIGGLLSLERISQDTVRYDNGRDHVRVMEIICAYVRHNAPASDAKPSPQDIWDRAYGEALERAEETARRNARDLPESQIAFKASNRAFGACGINPTDLDDAMEGWAKTLPRPREDIQFALTILGRRDGAQRSVESHDGKDTRENTESVFGLPCPLWPGLDETKSDRRKLVEWRRDFHVWRSTCSRRRGYTPDLSRANLQNCNLDKADLSGANFNGSNLAGASLRHGTFTAATFIGANLQQADLGSAMCAGAIFSNARLHRSSLQGAVFMGADFSDATLTNTQLGGAALQDAKLVRANLAFAEVERTGLQGALIVNSRLNGINADGIQWFGLRLSDQSLEAFSRLMQEQLNTTFGGPGVTVPSSLYIPAHWPKNSAQWDDDGEDRFDFDDEYERWLTNPDTYAPPPLNPPPNLPIYPRP